MPFCVGRERGEREREISSPFVGKKVDLCKKKKNARENEEMRRQIEHARGVVTELVHFRRSGVCLSARASVCVCVLMARVLFKFVYFDFFCMFLTSFLSLFSICDSCGVNSHGLSIQAPLFQGQELSSSDVRYIHD